MLKEEERHHQLPYVDVSLVVEEEPLVTALKAVVRIIAPAENGSIHIHSEQRRKYSPWYQRSEKSWLNPLSYTVLPIDRHGPYGNQCGERLRDADWASQVIPSQVIVCAGRRMDLGMLNGSHVVSRDGRSSLWLHAPRMGRSLNEPVIQLYSVQMASSAKSTATVLIPW